MADAALSPSLHAWLAVYYSELKRDGIAADASSVALAHALADAVELDYPRLAQEIREWTRATREAMLGVLEDLDKPEGFHRETTLWHASRSSSQARCVAVYVPGGIDVRLLEDNEITRTHLLPNPYSALSVSSEWRERLALDGWVVGTGGSRS